MKNVKMFNITMFNITEKTKTISQFFKMHRIEITLFIRSATHGHYLIPKASVSERDIDERDADYRCCLVGKISRYK